MKFLKLFLLSLLLFTFTRCDYTNFESTWRDPDAAPLNLRSEHIAAVLLSDDQSERRSFESNLARQLNKNGIEATPGYKLVSNADQTNQPEILAQLKETTVTHAVFMRVIDRHLETSYMVGSAWRPNSYYDPFLGSGGADVGPWGLGYASLPFADPGYYVVDTVVSVETMVYSAPDSKLVWTGLSKTMNPSDVDDFVKELVSGAVKHMRKTGFLRV